MVIPDARVFSISSRNPAARHPDALGHRVPYRPAAGVTSGVTRIAAKQGTRGQIPGLLGVERDEPACTEWLAVSGKMAVGGGIEPPTFRLTAGRCTNSTTPQKTAFRFRLAIKIRPS